MSKKENIEEALKELNDVINDLKNSKENIEIAIDLTDKVYERLKTIESEQRENI